MTWKDLLTEKDGVSTCPVRVGFMLALVIFTGGIIVDWAHALNYVFSDHAKDIASGYSNILGLGGAAIAGKNYTEAA